MSASMLQTLLRCIRCDHLKPIDAYVEPGRSRVCQACQALRIAATRQRYTARRSLQRARKTKESLPRG
jgi:hypothetical protein